MHVCIEFVGSDLLYSPVPICHAAVRLFPMCTDAELSQILGRGEITSGLGAEPVHQLATGIAAAVKLQLGTASQSWCCSRVSCLTFSHSTLKFLPQPLTGCWHNSAMVLD